MWHSRPHVPSTWVSPQAGKLPPGTEYHLMLLPDLCKNVPAAGSARTSVTRSKRPVAASNYEHIPYVLYTGVYGCSWTYVQYMNTIRMGVVPGSAPSEPAPRCDLCGYTLQACSGTVHVLYMEV